MRLCDFVWPGLCSRTDQLILISSTIVCFHRNLISLLAQALPQNSTFFINYILVVTFCITPLTLFRTRQILQQFVWYVLMRPSTVRQVTFPHHEIFLICFSFNLGI
jgi:hypothetical protein